MSPIRSDVIRAARAAAGYGPEPPRSHTKAPQKPPAKPRGRLDKPHPKTDPNTPAPTLEKHLDRVEKWLHAHPGPQPVRTIAEQLGIPLVTLADNRHTRTRALWRGIEIRLGTSRGWKHDAIPQTWEAPPTNHPPTTPQNPNV